MAQRSDDKVDAEPKGDGATEYTRRLSRDERRESILNAARRVFTRSGFAGARTREIAAEAGTNEAILYQHFASKEEMFEAAVAERIEELVRDSLERAKELLPYDPEASTQRMRTGAFIERLLHLMVEVAPLLGVALFGDREFGRRFYQQHLAPAVGTLSELVERAKPTWEHRDFDAELVTTSVIGMCFGVALDIHLGQRDRDIAEVADQLTEMIFEGLAAKPSE